MGKRVIGSARGVLITLPSGEAGRDKAVGSEFYKRNYVFLS